MYFRYGILNDNTHKQTRVLQQWKTALPIKSSFDGKLHSRDKFTHAAATCLLSVVVDSRGVSLSANQKLYQDFGKPRSYVAIDNADVYQTLAGRSFTEAAEVWFERD